MISGRYPASYYYGSAHLFGKVSKKMQDLRLHIEKNPKDRLAFERLRALEWVIIEKEKSHTYQMQMLNQSYFNKFNPEEGIDLEDMIEIERRNIQQALKAKQVVEKDLQESEENLIKLLKVKEESQNE
jgi:hypothetical protein